MSNQNLYFKYTIINGSKNSSEFEHVSNLGTDFPYIRFSQDSIPQIIENQGMIITSVTKSVRLLFLYDKDKYNLFQIGLMFTILYGVYKELYTGIRFSFDIKEVSLGNVLFTEAASYGPVANIISNQESNDPEKYGAYIFLGDSSNDNASINVNGFVVDKLVSSAQFPYNPILLAHEMAHIIGLDNGYDNSIKKLVTVFSDTEIEAIFDSNFDTIVVGGGQDFKLQTIYNSLLMKMGALRYFFRIGIGKLLEMSELVVNPRIMDLSYIFPSYQTYVTSKDILALIYLDNELGYTDDFQTYFPFFKSRFDLFYYFLKIFILKEREVLITLVKNINSDELFKQIVNSELEDGFKEYEEEINLKSIENFLYYRHVSKRFRQLKNRRKFVKENMEGGRKK